MNVTWDPPILYSVNNHHPSDQRHACHEIDALGNANVERSRHPTTPSIAISIFGQYWQLWLCGDDVCWLFGLNKTNSHGSVYCEARFLIASEQLQANLSLKVSHARLPSPVTALSGCKLQQP